MATKQEIIKRIAEIIKRDRAKVTDDGESLQVQQGNQSIRIQLNPYNTQNAQNSMK